MASGVIDTRRVAARTELTWRGLLLGAAITLVFTAANVYLGLKVGLTFASSIPAAVISMAVLRAFRNATIYENNIVQTVASAAGTLSSIIFVLPGLVMVGWWTGFPFWQSFGVCAVGGILGVMYSVPLRRALVTESDLPYPEGVAAAEVLKVGVGMPAADGTAAVPTAASIAENKTGLLAVVVGHASPRPGSPRSPRRACSRRRSTSFSASARRRRASAPRSRSRCSARDTSSDCRSGSRCFSASRSHGAPRRRS